MEFDHTSSDSGTLVYRERSHPIAALFFAVPGLWILVVILKTIVVRWLLDEPVLGFSGNYSVQRAILWLGMGGALVGVGFWLLTSRRLVFDRKLAALTRSTQFLFWRRSLKYRLAEFDTVSWKPRAYRKLHHTNYLYPITLVGAQQEIELCEETKLEEARAITRRIGEFCGFQQNHWDANLLTPGRRAYDARFAASKDLGGGTTWRVRRSASSLTWTHGFPTFGRALGLLPAATGSLVIYAAWIAFTNRPQAALLGGAFGACFLIPGVILLFGKRGVTLDAKNTVARRWVGLFVPMWSRRHDLSAASAVGIDQQVEELYFEPVVVNRVFLVGEYDHRIVLFRSVFAEEIEPFVEGIAEFLDLPTLEDARNVSGEHVTLTSQERETAVGAELVKVCETITTDGKPSKETFVRLGNWLHSHRMCGLPAVAFLDGLVKRIAADKRVSTEELGELREAIESVLSVHLRRPVVGSPKVNENAAEQRKQEPGDAEQAN